MEPLENIRTAVNSVLRLQREISEMMLLAPLPLLSSERRAGLALADEQDAEAAQLLLRVHDLKKSAILKRLSYSPTRFLPPEILGNIFVYAIPEFPHPYRFEGGRVPYYSVLEVNRRWRSIALSTSELWTEIHLNYNSIYSERSVTNLAIWLERAKHSKLNVRMILWTDENHIQATMWNMICEHLSHCSSLIHRSIPSIAAKHMAAFCNNGETYRDLISLEITLGHADKLFRTSPLASPLLPRLRYLILRGSIAGSDITFMAPHLEKLQLCDINVDCRSLCDILNRYSVARKLELDGVFTAAPDNGIIQSFRCHLNLEELTLSNFGSTEQFWKFITPCLCSLQTLVIRETYYDVYCTMPVLPSVRHLCFNLNWTKRLYPYHQYCDFLNLTPNITELSIDARDFEEPECPLIRNSDPIIKELFVTDQDTSSAICPRLRHVGIYDCRPSQKRLLRLSRSRTAFLLRNGENAAALNSILPFTITTQRCLALKSMDRVALPELEMACKLFPQHKPDRYGWEEIDDKYECVEGCKCGCEHPDCSCCAHVDQPSDSDEDP